MVTLFPIITFSPITVLGNIFTLFPVFTFSPMYAKAATKFCSPSFAVLAIKEGD